MHVDWEFEIKKLDTVEKVIVDELVKKTGKNDNYTKEMRMVNKEMWEEVGALSGHTTMDSTPAFLQGINFLKQSFAEASKNNREIKMLEKQMNSPYFSRIDFQEDGQDTESFYIGIYGLRRADTGEILIYDWRAPVSSMFYDYEPGAAKYECPSGYIKGELVLKRQYRIEKGQLLLMFDSTITIEDNILQDILAGNADNRMKTIVSTIQREQNRAIRCESKRVLAVQGPAGSGKTSIALHRAAYLLYRHRNRIKAENICLFTPNGIFAKYISSILPELGEDDIPCRTLTGLAQGVLGDLFINYETYADMMEWQLSRNSSIGSDSRFDGIRFKASKYFAVVLERFVEVFENRIIGFEDIGNGDMVFSTKEELEELFYNSYSHMPIAKRLARMELLVTTRVREFEKQKQQEKILELADTGEYIDAGEMKARSHLMVMGELEKIKKDIKSMFSIDICVQYRMLFEDPVIWSSCSGATPDNVLRMTAEALAQGTLYYEDQAPILYLMSLLGMISPDNETKHVIIDEAQDYSEVAFKLFSRLFPSCGITIVGDLYQNINPASGIGNLQFAGELLDSKSLEYLEFSKSYRSTVEIMEFASRVINSEAVPFGRHGKVPKVLASGNADGIGHLITECIKDSKGEGLGSTAIICRTLSDCHLVFRSLEKDLAVGLVENGDDEMTSGIVVIPSYLAKGLEFDAVIAVVLSENEYMGEEKQLFYTVCTRALHRLDVCAVEKSRIIERIIGPGCLS